MVPNTIIVCYIQRNLASLPVSSPLPSSHRKSFYLPFLIDFLENSCLYMFWFILPLKIFRQLDV